MRVMVTKSWPALKSCHSKRCKAHRIGQDNDDLLSELPQEILLSIISSFTMNEAARFSLVSRQCEFIWRCVPVLIFEDSQAMEKIRNSWEAVVEERPGFVRRVDRVLEKHLGTTIDELQITFDLDQNWQSHVDKWTAFALDKQVKRLELNLTSSWRQCSVIRNGVTSPICGEPLDLPPNFTGFKSFLTSLCLKYVNVTDEFFDYLSHSCPLLENLCIVGSKCLTRVSGSLDLKHLEVTLCRNLKNIDISARKLHSFILYSQPIELHISSASSLFEMSIGTKDASCCVAYAFDSLSEHFSQLVYLSVWIPLIGERDLRIDNPVAMPNLQHLELQVAATFDQSLLGWISLIAASPSLQKLTLKLEGYHVRDRPIHKWIGFPLKCLKTLELVDYAGQPIDLELAFFVLENASILEEVIVDFVPLCYRKRNDYDKREGLVILQMKLPQGIKLTVK